MPETVKHALVTALPISFLFFTGWSFFSAYLGTFGIDITEVDLPLQTMLVFSFRTLNTWEAFVTGVLSLLLLSLGYYYRNISIGENRQFLILVILIIGIVAVFKVLGVLAELSARAASEQVWQGIRAPIEARLSIEEEKRSSLIVQDYITCRSRRGLTNVFSTTSKSFLLCRTSNEATESGMMYTMDNTGIILSRRKIRRER
jgi:hypothetical protein